MELADLSLPQPIKDVIAKEGVSLLRPSQEKALKAGLLDGKNLLICTPTASGKTLIGEFAMVNNLVKERGTAIYIVPLVALASEKFREFKRKYEGLFKVALSVGDLDSSDPHLADYDIVVCTAEKLDSLLRHRAPWISRIGTVVVDEVHLLNDVDRGPTLEILLTILRSVLPKVQIIALSATIANPAQLAEWLKADLVIDTWRPVELKQGILYDGKLTFHK